jgi:3-phenylpropionate/trans-cinnamate dioxygenase ferredoxin subunit
MDDGDVGERHAGARIDPGGGAGGACIVAAVSDEFVRVCAPDEVDEGVPKPFRVDDPSDPARVLVRADGELYALSGVCPHEQADLSEGFVERGVLWCPIHSSGFDCRTGAVTHPPADRPLRTYRVVERDDGVYVRLERGT